MAIDFEVRNKTPEEKRNELQDKVNELAKDVAEFANGVPLSSYQDKGNFDLPTDNPITQSEIQRARNL